MQAAWFNRNELQLCRETRRALASSVKFMPEPSPDARAIVAQLGQD